MIDKNNFNQKTKLILSQRAAQRCSNPNCMIITSGPHTNEDKSVSIGEAAHIKGARPNSARYQSDMIPDERSNIVNGIWLCSKCHTLIDKDEKKFSVEMLYSWKSDHEAEIAKSQSGTGWYREILEIQTRKDFSDTSVVAIQLVIDKPEYWEYHLISEILRTKLSVVKKEYEYLKKGILIKKVITISKDEFLKWFGCKLTDLLNIINMLGQILNVEYYEVFSLESEEDPISIKNLSDLIIKSANLLLEWEIELKYSIFPDELKHIKKHMAGWGDSYINEIYRIHLQINKIFEYDSAPTGKSKIVLNFDTPSNLPIIESEIKKAYN